MNGERPEPLAARPVDAYSARFVLRLPWSGAGESPLVAVRSRFVGDGLHSRSMRRSASGPRHRIELHHHVFPPGYVCALRRIGVTETGGVPLPRWNAERALAVMDRQGIATAVTSAQDRCDGGPGCAAAGVGVGDGESGRGWIAAQRQGDRGQVRPA